MITFKRANLGSVSCMVLAGIGLGFVALPAAAQGQGQSGGQTLEASYQQRAIDQAITQWEYLDKTRGLGFAQYANFALQYPDFPRMETIRLRAEAALSGETPTQGALLEYFDRHPPLTNPGRAAYALALMAQQRPQAWDMARAAWRGGEMSDLAEATIETQFAAQLTQDDHAARVDALLWQGKRDAAMRHLGKLAPKDRDIAMARLSLLGGTMPGNAGLAIPNEANFDAGYTFTLVNHLRASGQTGAAIEVLASRQQFAKPAFDPEAFVDDMLALATAASVTDTVRIASKVDDLFAPGTDISRMSFKLRDQFTDLMWKGGTNALWRLGDAASAAPMFLRYGNAARTPLTKSKGYYWAGRAARQAGQTDLANRYFEMAAAYPHYYYGQLSLEALGRPMPSFAELPPAPSDPAMRAQFNASPLTMAIRAIAANRRDWRTERRFFEAIGEAANSPEKIALLHDLAQTTGLREMAVVVGFKAEEAGLAGLERVGFPTMETPFVNDWTMVHAISRQESEFDRTRESHAGARGIMQLMPGTARETAGKLGIEYMSASLFNDPAYNIRLGDAFFQRMVNYYNGSYPLAVAAYNAGPGNVNKWLRANGDPRTGAIDWQTWIERIEFTETRYYVMRVLGNAVSYSHMYPDKAGMPRTIGGFF
jgi:soluble lytic murein transglycosylase